MNYEQALFDAQQGFLIRRSGWVQGKVLTWRPEGFGERLDLTVPNEATVEGWVPEFDSGDATATDYLRV